MELIKQPGSQEDLVASLLVGISDGWKIGEVATSTYRRLPDPQPVYIDSSNMRRMHHGEAGMWIVTASTLLGLVAYSYADGQDKEMAMQIAGMGIGFGAQLIWDDKEDHNEWFH